MASLRFSACPKVANSGQPAHRRRLVSPLSLSLTPLSSLQDHQPPLVNSFCACQRVDSAASLNNSEPRSLTRSSKRSSSHFVRLQLQLQLQHSGLATASFRCPAQRTAVCQLSIADRHLDLAFVSCHLPLDLKGAALDWEVITFLLAHFSASIESPAAEKAFIDRHYSSWTTLHCLQATHRFHS